MDLGLNSKLAFRERIDVRDRPGNRAGHGGTGHYLVVNGRTEARVTQAVDEIRKKHPEARRERSAASLSKADAAEAAVRRFEKVDVLANTFEPKPFAEILDADWSAMIEAKSMSGARLSRRWLPRMLAQVGDASSSFRANPR